MPQVGSSRRQANERPMGDTAARVLISENRTEVPFRIEISTFKTQLAAISNFAATVFIGRRRPPVVEPGQNTFGQNVLIRSGSFRQNRFRRRPQPSSDKFQFQQRVPPTYRATVVMTRTERTHSAVLFFARRHLRMTDKTTADTVYDGRTSKRERLVVALSEKNLFRHHARSAVPSSARFVRFSSREPSTERPDSRGHRRVVGRATR